MNRNESVKEKKIFSIMVIASFVIGAFFLIFIQYISSNYTQELIRENNYLVQDNFRQALQGKDAKGAKRIDARVTGKDTTFLVSFEDKKNKSFQKGRLVYQSLPAERLKRSPLMSRTAFNASLTGDYLAFIMIFILCVGIALCSFIVYQFRQLNRLVIKLDQAEKKTYESLIIKENFLANMSHEIRTPLNSILGFTKIIQRRNVSPDISEFAGAIGHAGENLLRIVNDVLDLSKMEAGMLQIVKMPFSLRNLIHGVEALFHESINEKQLSFTVVIDAEVPDMINGDATRLTQILVNLIGNAVKFSDHGEISLAIVAEKIQNFELLLKFTVGDQGIGINSEKLDIIFERFRQAEDSITRQYGGTGLGLSIVRSLIHLQNGTLEINSQPKIGTEICFTLPYETADEIPPANVKANENQIDFKKNPIHLLVVEDNVMNQSLMKQLLLDWGIAFSIAADGVQAIELLEHKNFDLILMDLQMPRMDGYATTRHIRENLQLQIPVVAMTARVIEGEQQKCLDFGMDYYISKPINDAMLLSILAAFTSAGVESQQRTLPVILPQYNYIDLTYIKSVSNGNTQYEKSVTGQFLEMVPNLLEAIQLAYTNGNFKEICKIAHNMQTSFAIMGVPPRHSNTLDILENPDIQDEDIPGALQVLANVCTCAMKDAADFYNTLP